MVFMVTKERFSKLKVKLIKRRNIAGEEIQYLGWRGVKQVASE